MENIYLGPSKSLKSFKCSQSSNETNSKDNKNDIHEFVNPCTNELNEYLDYLENDLYNEKECEKHYEDVSNAIGNIYDNLSTGLELYNHYIYKVLKKNRKNGNNRRNIVLDDLDENVQLMKKGKNEEEIEIENEIVTIDEELDYNSDSSYEDDFDITSRKKCIIKDDDI